MTSKWTALFGAALTNVQQLDKTAPRQADLPTIVNLVSKVELFDSSNTVMPMKNICLSVGGNSQYDPPRFGANVLRFHDGLVQNTALVFPNNITIVHQLSEIHALYACHIFRLMIEHTWSIFRNESDGSLYSAQLKGHTTIKNLTLNNVVANGKFPNRVHVLALTKRAPLNSSYNPDQFPGLRFRNVRLYHPPNTPHCNTSPCTCECVVLLFHSGETVITGCKHVTDTYGVFYRFKKLVQQFVYTEPELDVSDRFHARLEELKKDTKKQKQDKSIAVPIEVPCIESPVTACLFSTQIALSGITLKQCVKEAIWQNGTPTTRQLLKRARSNSDHLSFLKRVCKRNNSQGINT